MTTPRFAPFALLALTAAACSRSATPVGAVPEAGAPSSTASVTTPVEAGAPKSAIDALPRPPALAAGAIKIVGYPKTVSSGMNDPAQWVGFTSDGTEYGYCADLGARDIPTTKCETMLADGTTKLRSTDDAKHDYSPTLAKETQTWMKSSGLTKLDFSGPMDKHLAKAASGSWAFSDIVIWLNAVGGDGEKTQAVVKLGGAVAGEDAVYPVVLQAKQTGTKLFFHTSFVNDFSISKDGSEVGLVGHFFCMEYCDEFTVYRNGTAAFASLVYNDTGFRHHKKGEFAKAAALFLEATFADPKAKLPPYNLACAYARLGDEHAKDALVVAIERDPAAKARAPKDADFATVKDSPWFHALTD